MSLTRRKAFLGLSSIGLASSSLAAVASCSTSPRAKSIARIALLSPLTGERPEIGKAIERAVRLAASPEITLRVLDTRGSVEGARAAGKVVAGLKPALIIGPASSDETRGMPMSAPVVTLSNDEGLQSPSVFVMGVTATQSTGAVLSYASDAGVKSLAIVRGGSSWSARCEAAAVTRAAAMGLRITTRIDPPAGDVVEALRTAGGGELPNAVLFPEGGAALAKSARELRAAGLQILGTSQWSSADITLSAAEGAWIAAADPRASARFVEEYRRQFGEAPGMIAGLAYDAMLAATILARVGKLSSTGLLRPEGFSGVTGLFRFTGQARPERKLAIVVTSPNGAHPVAGEVMPWA